MNENEELTMLALEHLQKGEKSVARVFLKAALKLNPTNVNALELMGDASSRLFQRLHYYQKAAKYDPRNPEIQAKLTDIKAHIKAYPQTLWKKSSLFRAGLIFLISAFIPFIWLLFTEIIPFFSQEKMTGEWNVAVAGFTNQETDLSNTDLELISDMFSTRLLEEMEIAGGNIDVIIQVRGSDELNPISGSSIDERASNAEKLADKINADMIIYGTVSQLAEGYSLQPEFYLRAKNLYEVSELIGQHSFGGSITIFSSREDLPSQIHLNIELARRSKILALVTRGLSFYLNQSYDQALAMFTQANNDTYWSNLDDRELLYLLLGNSNVRLMRYPQAELEYTKAMELEPEYSRGYIGLGNVYYLEAVDNLYDFDPDLEYLNKAERYYIKASQAGIQPESADIPAKVSFGLGQVFVVQWIMGEGSREQAIDEFNKVLGYFDNGGNPRLREVASETHARLGVIYRQDGQILPAIDEYELALELSAYPARKGLYLSTLGDLYTKQGETAKAESACLQSIEQYQLAINLTGVTELKALYWGRIGEQYEILLNDSEAIHAYEQALQLLPEDSDNRQRYLDRLEILSP